MPNVAAKLCVLVILLAAPAAIHAGLRPVHLRCEYAVDPAGIDVPQPRLSWVLEATHVNERGQKQTAYRVIVAGSRQKLDSGDGDLWDSGRVASDATVGVVYAGRPLASRARTHWKVQAWDGAGRSVGWSAPAQWSMGLLKKSDWGAKWIGDNKDLVNAEIEAKARLTIHSGYRTAPAKSPDVEKWVAIDLGRPQRFDRVRLFPAQPYNWHTDGPSLYFPVRFKIEAANQADFSDAKTVVDRTGAEQPQPRAGEAPVYAFEAVSARHVRLTITRLVQENEMISDAALAEMEVLDGERNVAQGAAVTALDSLEEPGWSKAFLVDGRTRSTPGEEVLEPAALLRKSFQLGAAVRSATAYVTARGLYELRINGSRVGERLLAPEWTSYHKRVQYQAYDVTPLLRPGANAIGATLGAGWYTGRVGLMPRRYLYGTRPQLLLRLEAVLADGRTVAVVSDESWRLSTDGPVRSSDILDGEVYDARKEMPGWDAPGFDDSGWRQAAADQGLGEAELVWQPNEPIRVMKEIVPVRRTQPKPGVYVFDIGQNIVGWCSFRFNGPAGATVTVRHAEMLNDDGTIYTANLRAAPQVDRFILRGGEPQNFEPHFTYHGFRYVELTGLADPPAADAVTGRVFYSSAPDAGSFETSSEFVNQLMRNIVWTQRANMESVPTDCPQRDERLGWMGDIQAFSQTAIFNMDMAGFLTKWLQDVHDDQAADGRFPDFAPNPTGGLPEPSFFGAPAWGDAGTVVPWRMYENYADRRIVEQHFEAARRWVDFIERNNPELLWNRERGNDYNDWLNGDTLILDRWPKTGGAVPKPVFATAFFAHSAELVSKMAAVLGRESESRRYRDLFERIKTAFNHAYVKADGGIEGDTQAGYALALNFNLLPEPLRAASARRMVDGFTRYEGHLSTGIQSTHRLMLELSRNGYVDEAYRLLNLRSFPSWGFMIENGATTIWERWDGYVKGRGFQNPGMNSFNHWAIGAVGEWMWRNIAGINPEEAAPGFKHFTIRPQPGGGLSWATCSYESIRGRIASAWRMENGTFTLKVTVPPNTTAEVYLPARDQQSASVRDSPAEARFLRMEDRAAVYAVGSGSYEFRSAGR